MKNQNTLPPGLCWQEIHAEVIGTFLFYARAVDSTMLFALSSLAAEQSTPTIWTMQKCLKFLGYAAIQEDEVITYKASHIVLEIHNNDSYLSEPKACSQMGG